MRRAALGLALALLPACAPEPDAGPSFRPGGPAVAPAGEPAEPGVLPAVASVPAIGIDGPGGRPFEVTVRAPRTAGGHARRYGTHTLRTALRTDGPDIAAYPCASCHVDGLRTRAGAPADDPHAEIRTEHPATADGACGACHAAGDVGRLKLGDGGETGFDHAYRLCAGCHFERARDWAAGAHGKRLDGWRGRRVVMGCGDCHDPHRPGLAPRVPFRPPGLTPFGRRDR